MYLTNEGFNADRIKAMKEEMKKSNLPYVVVDTEDNNEEYLNFYFVGFYEGREVIYDAVIYTLRLQHESELYEIAEHEAAKRFSGFKKIQYEEDENGDMRVLDGDEEEIGLFMAEIIMELEEEDTVKVKEHVELDPNIDFGVGLDAGLNVGSISHEVVTKFISDFNEDNLRLDDTLYSFQMEEDI